MVVDGSGYNPYSGRIIKGWPETVFLRGSVIVSNNQVIAKPGNGNFLPTKLSPNVKPKGVVARDLLKQNNRLKKSSLSVHQSGIPHLLSLAGETYYVALSN